MGTIAVMDNVLTPVRRLLWLVLVGAIGGAAWAWWRERTTPAASGPPEWPPLETSPRSARSTSSAATVDDTSGAPVVTPVADLAPTTTDQADVSDAPGDAVESSDDRLVWVVPEADGSCPVSHPIKANDNSGIFHVPGGRFYDRTKAERCYVSPEAATDDGYRRAKS